MAIGYGLQNLLQSPMAGGQQGQFPDPTALVSQIMGQFEEWLRKRGTGAVPSGGRQGIQQPVAQQAPIASGGGMGLGSGSGMPAIQPPVGTTPYAKAGRMQEAGTQGISAMMEQAGEEAAEPWKPKGLDIGLIAAAVTLPIIAALQPEGRGRRGQRKSDRMRDMLNTLGSFAGQGLGMRMGSFESGKKATYGAAESRAEIESEAIGAKYKHTIGGIEAEEEASRWGQEFGLKKKRVEQLGLPKPEKEPFTPTQLYRQDRDAAADERRTQAESQKDILVQANQITRSIFGYNIATGKEFVINSIQDLDEAIYDLEHSKSVPSPFAMTKQGGQTQIVLQQLKNLRDQYYGGETPMMPMGGGRGLQQGGATPEEQSDFERLKRKYGTQ